MPLGAGMVLGLLAATAGGSGAGSRLELGLALDLDLAADTSSGYRFRADAIASATVFLSRPLVDDATPLPLQPFLQRRSTLALSAGGGVDAGTDPPNLLGRGQGDVALDLYVTPSVAVTGGFGLHYHPGVVQGGGGPVGEQGATSIVSRLGLGYRVHDLRIDAALRYEPLFVGGQHFDEPAARVLRVAFAVRAVFVEHIDLSLAIETLQGGAEGAFHLDYYPSRRLGLLAGIAFAHGVLPLPFALPLLGNDAPQDRLAFRLGLSFWPTRHFGFTAVYLPMWSATTTLAPMDIGRIDHQLTVQFNSRLP